MDLLRTRLIKAAPLAISCNAIITKCDRKFSKPVGAIASPSGAAVEARANRFLLAGGRTRIALAAARGEEPVGDAAAAFGCAAVPAGTAAALAIMHG